MRDFALSLILHRIAPQWSVGWSTCLFAPISRQLFRLVMADRDNFIWLQAGAAGKGMLFNQMGLPGEGGVGEGILMSGKKPGQRVSHRSLGHSSGLLEVSRF